MASPRLELVGIEKSYGDAHVLRGAHLTADCGDIVGICGDNGRASPRS
jgi:ABC-type sugar transport system ATPase subunit